MILTTHSIVGSALARAITINPITAFVVGVAGHYVLDYIPHWEYLLASARYDSDNSLNNDMVLGKDFIYDLVKIGGDFFLGLLLSILFFYDPSQPASLFVVLAGVAGGVMPDFLQFVYMKLRCEPFTFLQRVHDFFHCHYKLDSLPYLNILIQVIIIAGAFVVGNL